MTKTLTHLAWYLERKWKYRWSSSSCFCCHSPGRNGTAAVTKLGSIFVVVLFLWLVYISVWAATVDISGGGDPGGGASIVDSLLSGGSLVQGDIGNNDLSGFPATGSATLQNRRRESSSNNFVPGGPLQSTETEAIPFKTMISYETLPKGINVNGTFITLSLPQFTRLERIFYR